MIKGLRGVKVVASGADESAVTTVTSTPTADVPTHRGADVLVVEDDLDVGALLVSHLRRLHFAVRSAVTGEDGLAAASEHAPAVVFVDIQLPGIDGREVVRALRADAATAGCRIVVTSVLDSEDLADLDGDAMLPKPFTRRDVAHVMASLSLPGQEA